MAEAEDLEGTVETELAVHLIFRVDGDWEGERDAAVAEMERKVAALTAYGQSPAFRLHHGQRVPVLRMRTRTAPPSIVTEVMSERGVEIEALDEERPDPGLRCAGCGRERLREDQVAMTERGWACPSCFTAWNRVQEAGRPKSRRLSPKVLLALIVGFVVLCLIAVVYEIPRFLQMNQAIRSVREMPQ